MLHLHFPRRATCSLLTGLLLLVPTALAASAAPEEAELQSPAPVVSPVMMPDPGHPQITLVTGGWIIDRGGPGTYFDRLADDGE